MIQELETFTVELKLSSDVEHLVQAEQGSCNRLYGKQERRFVTTYMILADQGPNIICFISRSHLFYVHTGLG